MNKWVYFQCGDIRGTGSICPRCAPTFGNMEDEEINCRMIEIEDYSRPMTCMICDAKSEAAPSFTGRVDGFIVAAIVMVSIVGWIQFWMWIFNS